MNHSRRLIKNTYYKSISQIVVVLSHLALIPITIHFLGLEQFGLLAVLKMLTPEGPIGALEFGVQSALTPFTARHLAADNKKELSKIVSYLFFGFLFIGFVLCALMLPFLNPLISLLNITQFDHDMLVKALVITIVSNIFMFPRLIFQSVVEGAQDYKFISSFDGSQIVVTNLIQIALLYFGFGLVALVAAEAAIGLIISALFFVRSLQVAPLQIKKMTLIEKGHFKTLLQTSKMAFLSKCSGLVFNHFDKIAIISFFGPAFVGVFEIMSRLPKFLRVFTSLGTATVTPLAAELFATRDMERLQKLFNKGMLINVIINVAVFFTAIMYVPRFFGIWLGEDYVQYAFGAQLLLFWAWFSGLGIGWNLLLGMNKRLKASTMISWSGTLIKIASFFALMNYLGEMALPVSYLIPQVVVLISLNIFFQEFQTSWAQFAKDLSISFAAFIPSLIFNLIVLRTYTPNNYASIIVLSAISVLLYATTVYFVHPERRVFVKLLSGAKSSLLR